MSAKNLDTKNRWRNKTIGFRVSPEEWDKIERLVWLSGMSKQDYIMSKLENREINITPNPRVFKALKTEIVCLTEELKRLTGANYENEELIEIGETLVELSIKLASI